MFCLLLLALQQTVHDAPKAELLKQSKKKWVRCEQGSSTGKSYFLIFILE